MHLIRSFGFYTLTVRASQKLHDTMFAGIISTTMRFFDTNPSGRILNRFSKDMGAVDEFLPKAFLDATQVLMNMGGAIIVTAIVNPAFLIPIVLMSIVFVFIRKIYLKTSKNIKRLESVGKFGFTFRCDVVIQPVVNYLQQNRRCSRISRPRSAACQRFEHLVPRKYWNRSSIIIRTFIRRVGSCSLRRVPLSVYRWISCA